MAAKYLRDGLYYDPDLACQACGCPVYRAHQRVELIDGRQVRQTTTWLACADCGGDMVEANAELERS